MDAADGRGGGRQADPDEAVEHLLDLAEDALDRGEPDEALELCGRVLHAEPQHLGAMFVAADAERQLGDLDRAEAGYRSVIATEPRHASAWSGLAGVLFDQLRFDEARVAALRSIRSEPDNAEGYWVRALLRERRNDLAGADRDFLRAARLDPDAFPRPERLSDAMITSVVEEAKGSLHPSVRTYLDQVVFLVEEIPSQEVCLDFDPPALPSELLGYFSGASLLDRSSDDAWSHVPSTIVLFRRNLERLAWNREHLVEELRITVLHEVGHFLGLDEEELEARGLD